MDRTQQHDLLNLLKALAQEHRLTMVGLMGNHEQTVSEMAEQLELTEPTVSHHVSSLREVGLLHLRMAGNQRFYRLNQERVKMFRKYVETIDSPPTEPQVEAVDNEWIDTLDWDAESKKVLHTYTANRRLQQIPKKEKKLLVILRWLATLFEPGARYEEEQVNRILTGVHEDYASLRRYLVMYGFMRRERGGGDYWLAPEDQGPQ